MPPILALILCLIFVSFVFNKEAKLQKGFSWSLWLPILWLMRCSSRGLSAWFNWGSAYIIDIEGSIHDRVFFTVLMAIGWIVLWRRRVSWSKIVKDNFFLFVFFAYMGLSVLWTDSIFVSYKRWIRTIGDLTMVLVVVTDPRPLDALVTVIRRTAYLLIPLSVILIKYFPRLGRMTSKSWDIPDMWIGVSTHKNALGQLCLFAGLVFLWDFIKTRRENRPVLRMPLLRLRVDVLYGLMLAYLLYGGGYSKSMTSILVLTFACGLFLLLRYSQTRRISPANVVFGLLLAGLVAEAGAQLIFGNPLYTVVAQSLSRDSTLTGRTDLWRDLISLGHRHALLGAGYGSFWTPEIRMELQEIHRFLPGQAHNGYIEVFLHLGLVGLLLFALMVGVAIKGALKLSRIDFEYGSVRVTLLLAALLHNYTEAGFPRPTHQVWFVFLLAAINLWHGRLSRPFDRDLSAGGQARAYIARGKIEAGMTKDV